MSGEDLRRAVKFNDVETVRTLLLRKANPCSSDEFDLTPLHYAVWNGHIECVKYVAFNPRGITKKREKKDCLNLQSTLGFTALHLAAIECPHSSAAEITLILLLCGIDFKLTDLKGKTAYDLARQKGNSGFVDSYRTYIDVLRGKSDAAPYRELLQQLKTKYDLHPPIPRTVQDDHIDHLIQLFRHVHDDELHGGVERVGEKPVELKIHEHLILPMSAHGLHQGMSMDALHTMQFAEHEAIVNAERRKKLMGATGQSFVTLDPEFKF